MDEKEHNLLDNNLGQKPGLLIQFFRVHFSSGLFIMRMMWSCQVEDLTFVMSDPCPPTQIRAKREKILKKKGDFLQETIFFEIFMIILIFWDFPKQLKDLFKRQTDQILDLQ